MAIRKIIIDTLRRVASTNEATLIEPLTDDTVLLQSGLDSLGFAILVAQLEENLKFDPFAMTDQPVYPRTLGEFIAFYEQMAAHN